MINHRKTDEREKMKIHSEKIRSAMTETKQKITEIREKEKTKPKNSTKKQTQ